MSNPVTPYGKANLTQYEVRFAGTCGDCWIDTSIHVETTSEEDAWFRATEILKAFDFSRLEFVEFTQ